ncbi:MAG: hypothetical protein EOP56_10320 [Sphingobacteriales bacterium]|nr:MAG: hypothetical protein EOP56_10320 [Sphingobacteriales bacterium]
MAEIHRSRTIRPSTRAKQSSSYKVDVRSVMATDSLIVTIKHTNPMQRTKKFCFDGAQPVGRDSIHFKVNEFGSGYEIIWYSDLTPHEIC